jgi:hypothetical protein
MDKHGNDRIFVSIDKGYHVLCISDEMGSALTKGKWYTVIGEAYVKKFSEDTLIWYRVTNDNGGVSHYNKNQFCNKKKLRKEFLDELLKE